MQQHYIVFPGDQSKKKKKKKESWNDLQAVFLVASLTFQPAKRYG